MISGETWKVALDALRANKTRAFLTMLGVVIGSACIVLVVTVALTGFGHGTIFPPAAEAARVSRWEGSRTVQLTGFGPWDGRRLPEPRPGGGAFRAAARSVGSMRETEHSLRI